MRAFVLALALIPAACPSPPQNPQPSDPCGAACWTLAAFRCPEAQATDGGESCAALCSRLSGLGYVHFPTACVRAATSAEGVRACGVRCLP